MENVQDKLIQPICRTTNNYTFIKRPKTVITGMYYTNIISFRKRKKKI